MAKLAADVKNIAGGKADPSDKEAKTIPPERLYTAHEELPWYAIPEGLELQQGVSKEAAKDFLDHVKAVPSWALAIAPMSAIKAA